MRYKLVFIPADGLDYYSPPEFHTAFYSEYGENIAIFSSPRSVVSAIKDTLTTADDEFFASVKRFEEYTASNTIIHFALDDGWYIISDACPTFNYDVLTESIKNLTNRRKIYVSAKTTLDSKQQR